VNHVRSKSLNQSHQSRKGKWIDSASPSKCRDGNSRRFAGGSLTLFLPKRRRIFDRIQRRDLDLNTLARKSLSQHAQLMRGIGAIQRIDDVQYAAHRRKTSLSC